MKRGWKHMTRDREAAQWLWTVVVYFIALSVLLVGFTAMVLQSTTLVPPVIPQRTESVLLPTRSSP